MKLVADIHLHSHYSRATSRDLTLEHLWKWAQIKGVQVVATGDIAHPGWLAELRDKLEPAESGLFRLKAEHAAALADEVPAACRGTVRFLIGGEISNIYKKYERTRKVHNIVFAPSFDATARLQEELEKIGNIRSDGRPILGLDSRDLLEIVLQVDDRCHLIPAHIWTPWFSILGSKSGFDSVRECYADLTPHIFAVETGLSSDPPMNWRVSWLDDYTLISSSDAHSPPKLAREATCFDTELNYDALFDALRGGVRRGYRGTIEFFPEEGKYHLDGHRKCGVCWEPATTRAHGGRCSACGKPVTVGVYHRMEELADRPHGAHPDCAGPFASLIPLPEALSEMLGVGPGSKRVQREYHRLVERLGPELAILREVPLEEIDAAGGAVLAEGIRRMRAGEVRAESGYDGEYGVIRLFDGEADRSSVVQLGMFDEPPDTADPAIAPAARSGAPRRAHFRAEAAPEHDGGATGAAIGATPGVATAAEPPTMQPPASREPTSAPKLPAPPAQEPPAVTATGHARAPRPASRRWLAGLNPAQRAAATHAGGPLAIVAGPGTGKTRTLTVRIAHLVRSLHVPPESILVLTFTHKAADELRDRLAELLPEDAARRISAGTFHQLGARLLEEFPAAGVPRPFAILDEADRRALLKQCFPTLAAGPLRTALAAISASKNGVPAPREMSRRAEAADSEAGTPILPATRPATAIPPEAAARTDPSGSSAPATSSDEATPPGPGPASAAAHGVPKPLPDPTLLRARYDSALDAAGALDLDDLVVRTVELLERDAGVRRALQQRYRWLSVDEYQDVNATQYRLLRLLTGGGANLCVIGDPDQAIYGFRGADHRYFLSFGDDFPGAETLRLDRNYRSAQGILTAAGQVMARNPGGRANRLTAEHEAQVKLDVYRAPTDKAEAEYVVHQVERMVGGTSYFSLDSGRVEDDGSTEHRSFADFAILYRLNAQAKLLEEAFDRSGIPYQTAGATPLAEQQPIREILALLWLTEVPGSRLHWRRVLWHGAESASEADLSRLLARVAAAGTGSSPPPPRRNPPATSVAGAAAGAEPPEPGRKRSAPASTRAADRADAIAADADAAVDAAVAAGTAVAVGPAALGADSSARGRLAAAAETVRALTGARYAAVAERVGAAAQGWAALRGRAYDDAELERIARLRRRAAVAYGGMREFLTRAALQSETDRYDERADRVALMSLHAAKGLEFPVVFIVGCEQGLLPYHPPNRAVAPADADEERRLFYVGMTRAQQRLILTHAARRLLFGQRRENRVSAFVTDIETALRETGQAPRRPRQPTADDLQLPLF